MSYNEGYGQGGGGREQYGGGQGGGYGGGGREEYRGQGGGGYGGGRQEEYGGQQGGGGYGGGRQQEYGGGQEGNYGSNENRMPHSSGTSYGGGGGYGGGSNDFSSAAEHAQQHAGSSGDSGLFSNALSMLGGRKQQLQNEDLDEQGAVQSHQAMYGGGGGGGGGASSGMMGSAAAMQALKMFGGGGGGGGGSSGGMGGGGGGGQNQFVGMAMGQASNLFDQQHANGNVESGASKQDAVSSAAQMALKMYMKSEMGSGGGGLMSMASKFM